MVILQGQHVQSTGKPDIQNEQLYPWINCNKSGWMDSETFYKWCEEFKKKQESIKISQTLAKFLKFS